MNINNLTSFSIQVSSVHLLAIDDFVAVLGVPLPCEQSKLITLKTVVMFTILQPDQLVINVHQLIVEVKKYKPSF